MTVIREIGIGDYVRSYDFPGVKDCYVEGTVVGILSGMDCDRYKIAVDRIVFDGKPEPLLEDVENFAYPPVNGTHTSFGMVTDYVELAIKE